MRNSGLRFSIGIKFWDSMFEIQAWVLFLVFMFVVRLLHPGLGCRFWMQLWDSGLGFRFGIQACDSGLGFRFAIQIWDSGFIIRCGFQD